MKKEAFFEVLGELDDDIVKGAETAMKKKVNWKVWGTLAACLCLAVGAAVFWGQNTPLGGISTPGTGGGAVVDGGNSEGMMYSVAVYPGTEREEDVASADVTSLTESEALRHELAEHLPSQLPERFHYGRGSLYHTVMKDGTEYEMLRVEYISGAIPEEQVTEDGGVSVPNPETIGDLFTVCVLNYEPVTNINIYSAAEEITVAMLEKSGSVYIRSGDCHVGVFVETAEPEIVFDALQTIE